MMKDANQHLIILKGVKIHARHGVMPQEQTVGAYFILDVTISTDFSHAMETDELTDTISYADVYEIIKREMAIPSKLLEHAGGRIVKAIHDELPNVKGIRLRLMKENPPMGADLESAGIEIEQLYN